MTDFRLNNASKTTRAVAPPDHIIWVSV